MKKEYESELCSIDPVFFEEMIACENGEMNEMNTCMYWGISCNDGWYEPLKKFVYRTKMLNELASKYNMKFVAEQIKEKFGGVRIYWITKTKDETKNFERNNETDSLFSLMNASVQECEEECWNTCENCGKEGGYKGKNLITTSGWISRICRDCSKKIIENQTKNYDEKNKQTYEPRITLFRQAYDFLNIIHKESFYYKEKRFDSVPEAYFSTKDPEHREWYSYVQDKEEFSHGVSVLAETFGFVFEEKDYELLKDIARCKFNNEYNKELKQELLNTSGKKLINMNHRHDNVLGHCYCDKCKDIEKKNLWGKILTELREEFSEKNQKNFEKII